MPFPFVQTIGGRLEALGKRIAGTDVGSNFHRRDWTGGYARLEASL